MHRQEGLLYSRILRATLTNDQDLVAAGWMETDSPGYYGNRKREYPYIR